MLEIWISIAYILELQSLPDQLQIAMVFREQIVLQELP